MCVCEKEPKAPALAPALGAAVGMASIALGVRNHNGASGSRSPVRPGTAGPSAAPQRVHKAAGRRALRCHGGASILGSKVSRPFFASPHTPPVMTGTSPFAGSPLSGLFLGYFCKQKCAVPPNVGPLSGSCIGPGRRGSRSVNIRLKGFVALSCCCFGSGGVAAMARDLRSCGQKARRGHGFLRLWRWCWWGSQQTNQLLQHPVLSSKPKSATATPSARAQPARCAALPARPHSPSGRNFTPARD